jgi:beta-glucosidase-like glycosyl hydrolase
MSIGDAAVACIKAGADIFLVCHNEQAVSECYEAVFKTAEKDRRFAVRVAEAARHVMAFKKRCPELKRRSAPRPSDKTVEKLRRQVWELTEQSRLATNSLELQPTQRTGRTR